MSIGQTILTPTVAGGQTTSLVVLATLQTELGGITDEDPKLARLIASCGAAFSNYLGFLPWRTTYVESLAGYGRPYLYLSARPIESVTSVTLNGATVDSTTYSVGRSKRSLVDDFLYRETGWISTAQMIGGIVAARAPGAYSLDFAVTYIAGWKMPSETPANDEIALPDDIAEAALRQCHDWYRFDQMDPSVAAETLGPHTIRYHGGKSGGVGNVKIGGRSLSPATMEVLDHYR